MKTNSSRRTGCAPSRASTATPFISFAYATDPYWRDLVLFNEYFHGETGRGLGASHQTGWTALAVKLLENTVNDPDQQAAHDHIAREAADLSRTAGTQRGRSSRCATVAV